MRKKILGNLSQDRSLTELTDSDGSDVMMTSW